MGNYIDLIIILVLLYFASEAFRHGFWVILVDFISFLGSILISLNLYKYASLFLRNNFSLPNSVSNAVGFLMVTIIMEGILGFILARFLHKIPEKYRKHKIINIFSLLPSLGEGLILVSFFLTLAISFPIKPSIKSDIVSSKLGGLILNKTVVVEKWVNEIFGGVIQDSLTYLTVKPGSNEKIPILTSKDKLSVDETSEKELFNLVNNERQKLGIEKLTLDPKITQVSRNYANYLWTNHYFGHISLDGKDVGDRLKLAGIKYEIAGENLALAPTVITAHNGLMASEGHRDNILDTRFNKIGIGVVDNGIYGKIFVQVFTD